MWQGIRFWRTQNFNDVSPEGLRQLRHSAEASFNITLEHVLLFIRLGTLYNSGEVEMIVRENLQMKDPNF